MNSWGECKVVRIEEGTYMGGGGKNDMVYKRTILYCRAVNP